MATSLKDLRQKIKSINGTKKITSAMQMISASKKQKSVDRTIQSRDYARISRQIVNNIASDSNISTHPLLTSRDVKNILYILVTSNKGLCGGFNVQVIKKMMASFKEHENKYNISIVTIGNKGKSFCAKYLSKYFVADYPMSDVIVDYKDIMSIERMIIDEYKKSRYDKVMIFYNDYVSALKQVPTAKQLLPVTHIKKEEDESVNIQTQYQYEPGRKTILDVLLPKIVEIELYQCLLESLASEHTARMLAMKNATDNAQSLIDDLTLTYNSLRQASITRELIEISAGAESIKRN